MSTYGEVPVALAADTIPDEVGADPELPPGTEEVLEGLGVFALLFLGSDEFQLLV